jgi:cysteinyl-tRNA synthetase
MLSVYNSLARAKQVFTPIQPGQINMYVCGMTVYDYCHLGHARVLVVFDAIYRHLMASGYDVTYVRNITDIDDKIIQRANERGVEMGELTAEFIAAMHEDCAALGVLPPTSEPRATANIDQIITMVETLIDKGFAYPAENGDVYYAVGQFEGYGKLSGKNPADLRSGARVEVDESKRDPLDFVLWKAAKPGEPSWRSPWGEGRPGWHIECSAMSTCCLGNHFDIHGGGADLQFPHHENEIAQSEAATGETFVNYWLHNGFVRVNEEKMSKSLNNFFTIRDVMAEGYGGEELRMFILASHYRSPLNYSDEPLNAARAALTRLYTALRGLPEGEPAEDGDWRERFVAAMDDDFNTPEAMAVLFDLAGAINRARDVGWALRAVALAALLRELGGRLGLLAGDADAYLQSGGGDLNAAEVEQLIVARTEARASKNWAESDRIRDLLKDKGVVLEDGAAGTTWRRV